MSKIAEWMQKWIVSKQSMEKNKKTNYEYENNGEIADSA